jgi:hypothetical protein
MSDTITNVLFKLESDSSKLRSDLKNVNTDLDNTKKSSSEASATFSQMGQGLRALAQQAGLGGLVQSFDGVKSSVTAINAGLKGTSAGLKTATTQTTLLGRAFKVALGPIALILGAVTALGAAFLSTQRGADALQRVINVVSVTFSRVLGVLQDLGTQLVDTFQKSPKEIFESFKNLLISQITNRINGTINLFKALGDTIKGAFTLDLDLIKQGLAEAGNAQLQILTGIKDAGKEALDFLKESQRIANEITDLEIKISETQVTLRKNVAELNKERIKSREIENDINLSLEERLKATQRTQQLSQEIANLQIAQKQDELALVKQINELNDSDRKDLQREKDLEAEIIELRTQAFQETLRSRTKEFGLIKQIADRNKEIADELFEATQKQSAIIEKQYNDRIKFLKEIKAEDIKAQKDIAELVKVLEQQKQDAIAEIEREARLNSFNEELDFIKTRNEIELLKLKESLANFKGTEEEKAEFIRDQTRTQILLLQTELEKLQSLDEILTPDEAQQLELNIQKIKTEIAQLGETLNDVTADDLDNFQENFLAVTDTIGQAFDQVFDIIAKRTSAELDRINEAINKSQGNIDEALELAKRGNVEALQIERARQEALERQREIAIQREEQQARRAIATQQALAAAQILAEVFKPGGAVTLPTKLALAGSLIGLLGSLVPAFEKGTDYAPEGWAVVDEKGAEIRTDKRGKIKSLGSNKGARMVYNELGDKIIPAHKSRAIIDSLGVQDVKDRDDKKEIARAIGKLQSNTNVIIDKNGLYVGIKGVKQQMTRAWQ